jgi:hypothetical protein
MLIPKPHTFAHSPLHVFRDAEIPKASHLDVMSVERLCANPFVCYAEGDDGDGDKGKEKTFTQDEVERIVKKRLAKSEKENAALTKRADAAEAESKKNADAIEKLQARLDSEGKGTDAEKELVKVQRQLARLEAAQGKLTKERDEAVEKAEAAASGLSTTKLRGMVSEGLRKAKAHSRGMNQAVTLMLHDGEVKLDDDGNFTATIDGVPYEKPEEAAAKWLETNAHFAEGSSGGSGSPRPGGNAKLLTNEQMDAMHDTSLLEVGLNQKPA